MIARISSAFLVAGILLAAAATPASASTRDTTYPACDAVDHKKRLDSTLGGASKAVKSAVEGAVKGAGAGAAAVGSSSSYTSDASNLPFYVAAGTGSCEVTYTDATLGACMNPGWVRSANVNHCGRKITATNLGNNKQVTVTVVDACGATPDSTFGCNDIAFTKAAFVALGGDPAVGHLTSNVKWNYID